MMCKQFQPKKRALLILASLALLLGSVGQGKADSIKVGTADNGNCFPFLCNDSGTSTGQSIEYQQVYSSSQFSGPINIGSLNIFFASQFGGSNAILAGNYDISFSTTSAPVNGLSTNLASNIGTPLQTFYDGTSIDGQTPVGGAYTINGTTPYLYDPTKGNLLIDIVVTNQADVPNGSGNGFAQSDDTGAVTSRAYALTNHGNSADSTGLVTQFNSAAPAVAAPEPSSLTLLSIAGSTLAGFFGWRRRKQTVSA